MSRAALHSASGVELYTPGYIADAARAALGGTIDLDPASCALANKTIKATGYFTGGSVITDGLQTPWVGCFAPTSGGSTVFLNPPGGTLNRETYEPMPRDPETGKQASGGISAAAVWWQKLLLEYRAGHVRSAVYYCFRLDVLQTIQGKRFKGFEVPYVYPFCIFKKRPKHYTATGEGKSPTHACAVFFLPERAPGSYKFAIGRAKSAPGGFEGASVDRFQRAFAPLGTVRV